MKAERWQQVEALYHAALERVPEERADFLDQACAGDAKLREEVQSLLDQEGKLSGLLESPAIEVAARLLASEERAKTSGALRGKSVSHYSILERIGAGGMGEVYRARDTKLGRNVALKVLREILARDPERMARFKREAQVLASLNHPNIATIYGFEESGGVRALAMELVEGRTLAERLVAQGPRSGPAAFRVEEPQSVRRRIAVQLEDALPIAKQIAEGLEYAHERGIIHRDLKPANIKITPEGVVKILDFGLAKALDTSVAAVSDRRTSGGEHSSPLQLEDSPTITATTEAGMILGTAGYMSPEQARGKPVDRRADIWAFGSVLYEMLTGKRAFEGETTSEILAAVIRAEPDWDVLPAATPPRIRELVRRCLIKDPRQRLRDIGEARIAIEEPLSGDVGAIHELPHSAAGTPPLRPWRRALPWVAGIVLGAILAGLIVWRLLSPQAPVTRPVTRFALALPSGDQLANLGSPALALSPDGSELVYVARHGDKTRLYLRSLNQLEAKPLAGTEGAACPFFSPDGQWIGFFSDWTLKKVSLKGGPPMKISDNGAPSPFGASWGANDTIIFSPKPSSLFQVSASGGTPRPVTDVNNRQGERAHRWPQILPGGDVLFNVLTGENWDEARIEIFSPKTGERHALAERGACPHYVAAGAIIYERGGDLMAVPFDLKALKATGPPAPVLEGVRTDSTNGGAQFSVSNEGSLAYIPGGTATPESTLVWVDRKGKEEPLPAPARQYLFTSLSPDGSRVAVQIGEPAGDIWVYDLDRQTLTRLTTDGVNRRTVWSPDGKRVAYGSFRDSQMNIYWANADGSNEERLTTSERTEFPTSFSPDGRFLAFHGNGLGILPLYGDRKPQSFLQTGFDPMFSPDGHWMAYCSGETSQEEIYVRPYPGPGEKLQVSNHGGIRPRWGQEGRELYYLEGSKVMRVAVTPGRELKLGSPQLLFEGRSGQWVGYESLATNDGKRFLMIKPQPSPPVTQMNVVVNWIGQLKHAASANPAP